MKKIKKLKKTKRVNIVIIVMTTKIKLEGSSNFIPVFLLPIIGHKKL